MYILSFLTGAQKPCPVELSKTKEPELPAILQTRKLFFFFHFYFKLLRSVSRGFMENFTDSKVCAFVKMVLAARWAVALFQKITLFTQELLFSLMHIEARVKNNSGLLMSHLTHDWMPIIHPFHKPNVKVINANNLVYLNCSTISDGEKMST